MTSVTQLARKCPKAPVSLSFTQPPTHAHTGYVFLFFFKKDPKKPLDFEFSTAKGGNSSKREGGDDEETIAKYYNLILKAVTPPLHLQVSFFFFLLSTEILIKHDRCGRAAECCLSCRNV